MKEVTQDQKDKLTYQLFTGKVCDVIGFEKTTNLLREAKEEINKAFFVPQKPINPVDKTI